MVQVNLVGKKRRERVGKNWITITALVLFGLFLLYFIGSAIYVVVRLTLINNEIRSIDAESEQISRTISANRENLVRYVLSKNILDRMSSLKANRFRYKDYIDQVSQLLPTTALLSNVDFSVKGWVDVTVSIPGVNVLDEMERGLADSGRLAQSEFASVFVESIASDRTGNYNAKLHFEIKTNGN